MTVSQLEVIEYQSLSIMNNTVDVFVKTANSKQLLFDLTFGEIRHQHGLSLRNRQTTRPIFTSLKPVVKCLTCILFNYKLVYALRYKFRELYIYHKIFVACFLFPSW